MDTDARRSALNATSEGIIGGAYEVGNELGCGFVEKVYENAMVVELRLRGMDVRQQYPIKVLYKEELVGDYIADLLVADHVLVELKAVKALDDVHLAQCMNYLKATGLSLGLLINFGRPKVQVKRVVNNF